MTRVVVYVGYSMSGYGMSRARIERRICCSRSRWRRGRGGARGRPRSRRRSTTSCRRSPTPARCTGDEILEDKGGICPICKMDAGADPARLGLDLREQTARGDQGRARDAARSTARALVQVTAAISWTCPGSAEESVSPGTCPRRIAEDEEATRCARTAITTRSTAGVLHGHRQHAPSRRRVPADRHFRMYFYDEFTKPQTARRCRSTRRR